MSQTIDPTSKSGESPAVRWGLTIVAVLFLAVFVLVPIANIFSQALSAGWGAYVGTFAAREHAAVVVDPKLPVGERIAQRREAAKEQGQARKTQSAIRMTIGVAA